VLSFSDLKSMLANENRSLQSSDLQLRTNHAFVFFLSDGRAIMLANPLDENARGILFESQKCLYDCIEKDYFPIDGQKSFIAEENVQVIL